MSRCNIEFYDHQFNYIFNDSIESPDIDEDYLSPAESSIVLGKIIDIPLNGFVYIDEPYNFLGYVTAVDSQDYTTEIRFQPFVTIFNQPVLFDTNKQGKASGDSLEKVLGDTINKYWINSNDSSQNLSFLKVKIATNTLNWGFNLKSDNEDQHHCIINFYDVLAINALIKYNVVLTTSVDRTSKAVTVTISKIEGSIYIDTDLNNVKIDSFVVNDLGSVTNKLEIWNSKNYREVIYYYLHSNGKYDKNNTDRIEPVKLSVISVDPRDDEDGNPITFEQAAAEQAASEFENIDPVNNIEIEILRNDELVHPESLYFGQTVMLVHDGTVYTTILTGKRHSSFIGLMFGVTRADLTKKIKMRTNSMSYSDKFINYRSATDTRTGTDTSIIGTRNYKALSNKPSLNGVTINNNQTLSDIGIDTITNSMIEEIVSN